MQPTSKFGELFQYSNPMAGAAGFTAGHVALPGHGARRRLRQRHADPGLRSARDERPRPSTTRRRCAATTRRRTAPDVDGKTAHAVMEINYAIIPLRPAGAAWSNVRDMLRYVQMELDEGALPDGKHLHPEASRSSRAASRRSRSARTTTYGMGLMVDTTFGVPVVHHGGDMIGYHSDMMWLPEQDVGAVILTNGDPGWMLRTQLRRKLLEVLFDGRPEADAQVASAADSLLRRARRRPQAAHRSRGSGGERPKLASQYKNAALGEIAVTHPDGTTVFDFGEWKSPMASRKNPDGTVSFVTTRARRARDSSSSSGSGAKQTLTIRDGQHEYVFEAS